MINEEKIIISNGINIGTTIAYKDKNEKRQGCPRGKGAGLHGGNAENAEEIRR